MLLGLSNTAGVLAGVLGTAATGHILQHGRDSHSLLDSDNALLNLFKTLLSFICLCAPNEINNE